MVNREPSNNPLFPIEDSNSDDDDDYNFVDSLNADALMGDGAGAGFYDLPDYQDESFLTGVTEDDVMEFDRDQADMLEE